MAKTELQVLLENVPDPTDFPSADVAPGLRELDEALVCDVCREFYSGPMILECGHSFCSYCLRRAFSDRQECPKCRAPANEMRMKKNVELESVVSIWKSAARECILDLLKRNQELLIRLDEPAASGTDGVAEGPPQKRQRVDTEGSDDEVQFVSSPLKQPSIPSKVKVRPRNGHGRRPSGSSNSSSPGAPSSADGTNGLVNCPLCQKQVPLECINPHIDSGCQRFIGPGASSSAAASTQPGPKGKQKREWSKLLDGGNSVGQGSGVARKAKEKGKERERAGSMTPDPEYLPKEPYDIIKLSRLKELLQEHGLSTHDERNVLVSRHKQWVMLYNANIDCKREERRSIGQLRQDMKRWEEEHKPSNNNIVDTKQYERQQDPQFKKLIAQVKSTGPAKPVESSQPQNIHQSNTVNGELPDGQQTKQEPEEPDLIQRSQTEVMW
ncbi:uncharacterized protein LAESUDRAFT_692654 [Laetiporus sulphureus 93-53]|uniref:Postreplication repair E3 ubiquitin-protein ligase RAD18 n=1 Tax=Laetiporus sulphureus 93-53 TaxID=1314785 RepID=A0A165HE29_9APHY|nr:uncharacterized protein LAESUDRAFT_692654 [Laetiporus sulphureus 93-53]KZT11613.1 hypothetical protein LAESUDRAFT_692654 [Laetiporus sulphureus 93-53]